MCECCDLDKGGVYVSSLYVDLSMRYDEMSKCWRITAYGDDKVVIKINYCPFCGRKLEENIGTNPNNLQ